MASKKETSQNKGQRSGGWLWGRFGGGARDADLSPAARVLKSVQVDLPETDPLRRARVQAARFMAQLPPFSGATTQSPPLAHPSSHTQPSSAAHSPSSTHSSLSAQSPSSTQSPSSAQSSSTTQSPSLAPSLDRQPFPQNKAGRPADTPFGQDEARQAPIPRVQPEDTKRTENERAEAEAPALAALRAEKQERAKDAARQADSPSRRRVDELRAEHRATRPRLASAPAPSSTTSRRVSAPARAAVERAPARVALSSANAARPHAGLSGNAQNSNRSINALVLLVMLLVFALFGALIWYGYGWYRGLLTQQDASNLAINAPAIDTAIDTATPTQTDAGTVESIAIPTGDETAGTDTAAPATTPATPTQPEAQTPATTELNPAAEPTLTDAPAPAAETTQDISISTPVSSEDLREAAYQDAVLSLERELAQALFLDLTQVDDRYTIETQDALRTLADTIGLRGLGLEVLTAGDTPTRAELENWLARIKPNL